MNNIRVFLSENFQFLEAKFSIYLNRHVFVMESIQRINILWVLTGIVSRKQFSEWHLIRVDTVCLILSV